MLRSRWVWGIAALVALAVGASALERTRRANSAVATAEAMRDELARIRAEVDACVATRGQGELRIQALDRSAGELRAELDSLEGLDPRGIPGDQYERYLSLVEAYNDVIPVWEGEVEALRELSVACDSLVGRHNAQADSLQRFLVEEGIMGGSVPERVAPDSSRG